MPVFTGKRVAFAITGGIAAYKAAEVVSWLTQNHCQVQVMMTRAAQEFITPLTLRALSGRDVATEEFATSDNIPISHISTVADTDAFIVLPATANVIAKAAHGIADDLVTSALLAATCPIVWAPAMNLHMYENVATQKNLEILAGWGHHMIQPGQGRMACGTVGKGRLADFEDIKQSLTDVLLPRRDLAGKRILVTAGPTVEPIDPVRYITNRSSGKMGYALARAALRRGAKVTLVSGPTNLQPPRGADVVQVQTAQEMHQAALAAFDDADVVIAAAAVGDYRPKEAATSKMKKTGDCVTIVLQENPDILKDLGRKKTGQVLVGFAAESDDLLANAKKKLESKHLDFIVANDVTKAGAGFDYDTNIITILSHQGQQDYPLMRKDAAAEIILDQVVAHLSEEAEQQ